MKKFTILFVVILMISSFPFFGTSSVNAATVYTFGVPDPDDLALTTNPPPALNTQGTNNFYFYYSLQHNVTGKATVSSFKECEYAVNRNSYGMKFFVPKLADVKNYTDVIWPTMNETGNPQFWWKLDKYGFTCPAGDMTNIVAFKAPAAGTYEIDARCYGGAKDDQGALSEKADGVSFAMNRGDTNLWSKNTGKTSTKVATANIVPKQTLTLAKDEMVSFTADPNNTFDNDLGHWYIVITQKTAASSASASPTPSSGKTSSSGKPSGSSSHLVSGSASASSDTISSQDHSSTGTTESILSENGSSTQSSISNSADSNANSVNNDNPGGNSWIWIVVIVVLAIGIPSIVFMVYKKKRIK